MEQETNKAALMVEKETDIVERLREDAGEGDRGMMWWIAYPFRCAWWWLRELSGFNPTEHPRYREIGE